MSYNMKIIPYPAGWQVRFYDTLVGFCACEKPLFSEKKYCDVLAWDPLAEDYTTVYCDPDKMWTNPFSGVYEHAPKEMKEPDHERSLQSSMNRTKNRVYHLARSNVWEWFVTLTFNPAKVDSFDYDDCVKHLKSWIDTVRRACPGMKYLIVPEKHTSGRFHFHGLFADCQNLSFTDSGYLTKDGRVIYNIGSYRLGFTTATKVRDSSRVTGYIGKYITKDLCQVSSGKKRYWSSRNLEDVQAVEVFVKGKDQPSVLELLDATCKYKTVIQGAFCSTVYYEFDAMDNVLDSIGLFVCFESDASPFPDDLTAHNVYDDSSLACLMADDLHTFLQEKERCYGSDVPGSRFFASQGVHL